MEKQVEWLLTEKYNWTKSDLIFNNKLPSKEEKIDIAKLKKGVPIEYIIGFKNFLNCKIDLSLKPLIPRQETEYWVEKELNKINSDKSPDVLDLCCGSGCIGIAILRNIPTSRVDFVDISAKCLAQTTLNLKTHKILNLHNAQIIKSNLFAKLKNKKYNYIFCNPPYVNPQGKFQKSLKFEPKNALFAKDSGLYYIKKILNNFNKYLLPEGKLFLEFGFGQKTEIENILKSKGYKYNFKKDQFNKWRTVEVFGAGEENRTPLFSLEN